ncbi:hypothetical protein RSOL_195770, partial [Rhizoctonia solani AG-3 Rhs1AP]
MLDNQKLPSQNRSPPLPPTLTCPTSSPLSPQGNNLYPSRRDSLSSNWEYIYKRADEFIAKRKEKGKERAEEKELDPLEVPDFWEEQEWED